MSKTVTVEITAPKDLKEGEVFSVEILMPTPEKKPRGQLAGIALEDMTDGQLKIEIINANSVLYKAKQRGAAEATIANCQARVDAAYAEKAKRAPAQAEIVTSEENATDVATDEEITTEI